MRATIKKIHPIKHSRNYNSYIRVEFQLEDGTWAKTDLCPDYRNYSRWQDALKAGVGTVLTNLQLKKAGFVNADSYPSISREPLKPAELPKTEVKQGALFPNTKRTIDY